MTTFNEYRKQQELLENSLYTSATKQTFMDDDRSVMSAFMFNFVAMLIGFNIVKDNKRVRNYFKNDLKLQIDNITDDNNDMSLIIKILNEKKAFKSSQTATQITRFLVKLKQGGIDEVNPDILIGWMDDIKTTMWSKLPAQMKVIKEEFAIDKDQYKAFMSLRHRARVATDIDLSKDFWEVFRGATVDKSKVTKWSVDMVSKKSSEDRLSKIGGYGAAITGNKTIAQATIDTNIQTPTLDKQKEPAKPQRKDWPGIQEVIAFFDAGGTYESFKSTYRSNATQRKDCISSMLSKIFALDGHEKDKLVEYANFIKGTLTNEPLFKFASINMYNKYKNPVFGTEIVALKRILIAQELGIFDGITNAISISDNYNTISRILFSKVLDKIVDDQNLDLLNTAKGIVSKLGHGLVNTTPSFEIEKILTHAYLRSKNRDEFVSYTTRFIKFVNGKPILDTPTIDSSKFNVDSNVMLKIMSDYNIEKPSQENAIISYLSTGNNETKRLNDIIVKSFGNDPYSNEINEKINDQFAQYLNSVVSVDDKINTIGFILKYFYEYNKELLTNKIADRMFEIIHNNSSSMGEGTLLSFIIQTAPYNLEQTDRLCGEVISSFMLYKLNSMPFNRFVDRMAGGYYTNVMEHNIRIINKNDQLRNRFSSKIFEYISNLEKINTYDTLIINIRKRSGIWEILTQEEKNKIFDVFMVGISNLDHTKYGYKIGELLSTVKGNDYHTYKKLSETSRKLYLEISRYADDLQLADEVYFKDIGDDALQRITFNEFNRYIVNVDSDEEKNSIITRYYSAPANKEALLDSPFRGNMSTLFDINEKTNIISEQEMSNAIESYYSKVRTAKQQTSISDMLVHIDKNDYAKLSTENKRKILKETLALLDDVQFVKKQSTNYRDACVPFQSHMSELIQDNRAEAQKLYETMTPNLKRRIAQNYLSNAGFSSSIEGLLHNSESPIVPYEKLDKKRIKEILKYNNVTSDETNISEKWLKSFDTLDAYLKNVNDTNFTGNKLEDLKVEFINSKQEDLDKIAVDLHRNKRNGNHGDTTMKIIRSFKVSIPMQEELHKEWIESHKGEEIINPMFHGTGSIAASMILRYGFRVISTGDKSVVGRLLGNGVYGSNIVNKAQQYVSDRGGNITRRYGSRGYLFKMDAALGKLYEDYRVAGVDGRDGIRSPEWCVFTPNAQYKIYHAYEVELIGPSEMEVLLKKYPEVVTEKSFKDYLVEQTGEKVKYTTYTFVNGIIPNGQNPEDICDFEDWKSPSDRITLEPSAYGPSIVIAGTEEEQDYLFTSVSDFRVNFPEEYKKFLKYFV